MNITETPTTTFCIQFENVWYKDHEWQNHGGYEFPTLKEAELNVKRIKGYFGTGGQVRVIKRTEQLVVPASSIPNKLDKK